jgi:hypothetical protein
MSNRNGFSPRDGQATDLIHAATEQGRREGAQAVMQQLSQHFPAMLQSEMGPDVDGKRAINSKAFIELAQPVTVALPGRIHVLGGMTKRLAVATSIMGPLLANRVCNPDYQPVTNEILEAMSRDAARTSLVAADVLIAMERADREMTKVEENGASQT